MIATDEELVLVLLHEIVDDVFRDRNQMESPRSRSLEEQDDLELLPPEPALPPELPELAKARPKRTASTLVSASGDCSAAAVASQSASVPPPSKTRRRRLGVNAGAHEQIVRLRNSLDYVTGERDQWRLKCKEAQVKVNEMDEQMLELQSELTEMRRLVQNYRRKQNEALTSDTKASSFSEERES